MYPSRLPLITHRHEATHHVAEYKLKETVPPLIYYQLIDLIRAGAQNRCTEWAPSNLVTTIEATVASVRGQR